jgi:uncharacterized protein (DUF427 family)
MWQYDGQQRPAFAAEPGPGQESVWDYPRPPALVRCKQHVEVKHGDRIIADSTAAIRVLETASPPTVYIPPDDIDFAPLIEVPGSSVCEWKGAARYWGLASGPGATPVGWSYPEPRPAFSKIRDYLCFYPGRIACFLDTEHVRPQAGGFYGGWVTDRIVGPWKGGPDTGHW